MDAVLSLAAKGFLIFSDAVIIAPLFLMSILIGDAKKSPQEPKVWTWLCLLVLFTMIFNVFLKSLFLIPLNPALGKKGFAFPSGHMQVSVVFYGWLFRACAHPLVRGMLLLILAGIGYGLIHEGYHDGMDVGGAFVVGVGTLYAFSCITRLPGIQKNPSRLGLCLTPLAGAMIGAIHWRVGVPPYTQKTFIGLAALSTAWFFYSHFSSRSPLES